VAAPTAWLMVVGITALELYWDRPDKLCVDLSGRRPMLQIVAEFRKRQPRPAVTYRPRVCRVPACHTGGATPRPSV
jgi:hypothetical protein